MEHFGEYPALHSAILPKTTKIKNEKLNDIAWN
jgi:hypothetical protein